MAQPLKLYLSRPSFSQPESITLGHSPDGHPISLHRDEIRQGHWFFSGRTGAGKSRAIALILQQLVYHGIGRAIFLDPMGEIYSILRDSLAFHARECYMRGESEFSWFQKEIVPRILLWDLSDKHHHLRHNMLKPLPGEDLSDVIARNIKFADSLYSSETGEQGMELQLNRRGNLVALFHIFMATNTPFGQAREFIYNHGFRINLLLQAKERSNLPEVQDAVKHFVFLEEEFKGGRWAEKIGSLETAVAQFFENPIVRNFLTTGENNVDFQDVLEHRTLIVNAPANDLPTRKVCFKYLYNMFFDLAAKRKKGSDTVWIGSDESSIVVDRVYADMITRIRNYGCLLMTSIQSGEQMLNPEKIRMIRTVASQSRYKMLFANDYEESERNVDELFSLTGQVPKSIEVTTTLTRTATESSASSVSETSSEQSTAGVGQSIGESLTETSSKNYSVTDAIGIAESLQKQWSEAETRNDTKSWNVQDAFTYSESASRGLQQIRGKSLTFTLGRGKTSLRVETETGVVTIGESEGQTETRSESSGYGSAEGISESYSEGTNQGKSLTYTRPGGGHSHTIVEGVPIPLGEAPERTVSESTSNSKNVSNSNAKQRSRSIQSLTGMAESLSKMLSRSKSTGRTTGRSTGVTCQEGNSLQNAFSEAVSEATGYARAIQRSLGQTQGCGSSRGLTQAVGNSLSRNAQRAFQQGESLALATAKNWGQNLQRSMGRGTSCGNQLSCTIMAGMSLAISWKVVCYTIPEERTILAQSLRSLQARTCYFGFGGENPAKTVVDPCLSLPTEYGDCDFRKILEEYYRSLPLGKTPRIFPVSVPGEPIDEVKIFPSLPQDFDHFFPPPSWCR